MSIARVRVEARSLHPNASQEEKDRNFYILKQVFKKAVENSGIITRCKDKQAYESKGEKKRRKRKEAALQRRKDLHVRLRERFGRSEN
jgi:ribosomal protein S21